MHLPTHSSGQPIGVALAMAVALAAACLRIRPTQPGTQPAHPVQPCHLAECQLAGKARWEDLPI